MAWLATMVALVAVQGTPEVAAPALASCPAGARLIGDPPPVGQRQWCAVRGADGKLVFHGHFWQWSDAGTLEIEGDFDLGKRTGRWVEYDASGERVVDSSYRDDVLDGPYVGLVDGQRIEGRYKAGLRDGPWRYFARDGSRSGEGAYRLGVRTGKWSLWLDDGSRAEGAFVDDERAGRWVVYGANGLRRAEGQVVRGKRTGRWREFDARGALLATGPYLDDQRSGKWTIYDSNGHTRAVGLFRADQKDGPWTENDSEGRRWMGRYEAGLKQGLWTCLHFNGKPAERGLMRDGARSGEWSYFDRVGTLIAKGAYVDDERAGVWIELTGDGGYVEGEYRDGEREGSWVTYTADGAARGELRFSRGLRLDDTTTTAPGVTLTR